MPVLALTGCDAEVVRDDDRSAGSDTTDGAGGAGGREVDPERQCVGYALINDHVPGCTKGWNHVSCERKIRHTYEVGCSSEGLELLHCWAVSCQTSAECRMEEDALKACYGTDG